MMYICSEGILKCVCMCADDIKIFFILLLKLENVFQKGI
jgi:hypothetical protein